ncbi:hypothetical protein SAMN05444156_2739 [Verrucomicrobium sp. GAS474]|uniref:hypothetical protein n=1 Tax=Verrucomicrobium sp. GAS474 TaxID=1882831 RepID=UPI00087DB95C|nr:hypothetical protein [Verrucomicrobium sp. GAS474]SDU23009.1 hypothetical protein SAMN05444156_2739 [Verrucomicrobium sp. GAS474]
MKKLIASSLLVAFCAFAPAFSASAACDAGKCTAPEGNKWHLTTVKWIKANENDLDRDDTKVAIIGKVTAKHNDHVYFFTDEDGGKIQLDSDIDLPVGKTIVIRGRVDQAFLHIGPLEINVDSWRNIGKLGEVLK